MSSFIFYSIDYCSAFTYSIWEAQPKQASWMVQKILQAKKYYEEVGWKEEEILRWPIFSVKKMYMRMRGEFPKVDWRRLTCNNAAPRGLHTILGPK